MKDLPLFTALMIAIIPAVITAISNWMLKLYEIRQAKENPKITPEETREKLAKKKRKQGLVFFTVWCLGIAQSLAFIIWAVAFPATHHNLDAITISLNITLICWYFNNILRRKLEEKELDYMTKHATATDQHAALIEKLVSCVQVLSDEIEKLKNKKTQKMNF